MATPSTYTSQTPSHATLIRTGPTPPLEKNLTVLWALDPYATEDIGLQEKVAEVIASLSSRNARIFPVYALERKGLNWDGEYNTPSWADDQKPQALAAIDALLEKIHAPFTFYTDDIRPAVIAMDESSHAKAVHQLVRFAKKVHADVIAIGSHGTSNIMQLLTGSFIEAFLNEAQIPLLVVNEKTQSVRHCCESLIFATDFSPACVRAFDAILPIARSMGAEIHLFYRVPNALDPLVQGGVYMFGGGWISIDTFIDEHTNARTEEGARWVERAVAFGVKARWVASAGDGPIVTSTATAVVDYASAQTNPMIVISAQSEPFMSLLFGSVTKDILRGASCPVFVVPSRG